MAASVASFGLLGIDCSEFRYWLACADGFETSIVFVNIADCIIYSYWRRVAGSRDEADRARARCCESNPDVRFSLL